MYPDPGNVSQPPTWEDFERLSLHYPQVHAALTMWRAQSLTKEQALIAATFALARSVSLMHADVVLRLSKVERLSDADLRRLGPPRWQCKQCGKERRRGECLHCGNVETITDEPMMPGAVR